ncbi:hypothetical protein ACH42_17705 [Endozoicomonas sp. (ex Bugula neritina AB1)]|nr:hypothetical protein ACH42_17705 [Endozoicomonas sp. (ex Bugula neritina AB1)]
MSYHQSDEEQVELLKSIWKDYGQPILLGVAITLAAVSGYKYWNTVQSATAAEASGLYQNLLDTVNASQQGQMPLPLTDEQKSTVNHVVSTLQADFTDSRYAALATLFKAQQQVKDNDLAAARESLQWILTQKPDAEVDAVVRIRLARVMLNESQENGQKALDILSKVSIKKAYTATIESVKGDAYLALGKQDQARAAYQLAVDSAQASGENRPLLKLKLDDLAAMAPQEG